MCYRRSPNLTTDSSFVFKPSGKASFACLNLIDQAWDTPYIQSYSPAITSPRVHGECSSTIVSRSVQPVSLFRQCCHCLEMPITEFYHAE